MQVYLIQNLVNGKCYVGQTVRDLDKYFSYNLQCALSGKNNKPYLYAAIRKYGSNSFTITELRKCADKVEMDDAEKAYIKLFGTKHSDFGYNLTDGGDGTSGYKHSQSSIEKIRESAIGSVMPSEARDKIRESAVGNTRALNRVFSEESRAKMSASARKRSSTEDGKKRLDAMRSARYRKVAINA